MKVSLQMEDITPEQAVRVLRAAMDVAIEKEKSAAHKPADGLLKEKETPPRQEGGEARVP